MSHFISDHYQGAAGESYHRNKREIPERAFEWVARARARKFQNDIGDSEVVLEYGAGYGWNLAALKCARKIGFDVAAFLKPELERRGIEFCESTATIPDQSIDTAICHHTLEHVLDPAGALREIRRLLKKSGKLLLTVPSENRREGRTYNPAEPNHHLFCWNPQTLGNLVTDCGFEVRGTQIQRYGYDRFAAKLAARFLPSEPAFLAIRKIAQILVPIYEVVLSGVPLRD
jgi:SAM-dependent methyltransferase